ncbi:MAG: hypothetical protein ORN51_07265 [Akkermansiaceae bacterium]|nr:hypothetical protein [Akkermansiaceae bacterium]
MKTPQVTHEFLKLASCFWVISLIATSASASSRRFCYSTETTTMPTGAMELETFVTWKTNRATDPADEHFDIRHEFEYGLTDRLQLAFYFADWQIEDSLAGGRSTEFKGVAAEVIYNLSDPNTAPFGSAVYGEMKGGEDFIELEGKFLLQKNRGAWSLVYNVGGEVEWEDGRQDPQAELMQSAGALYQLLPSWSVGVEILHEIAMPDAKSVGDSGVYLGPNVAWRSREIAVTVAGLWQATSLTDAPDFQLRTIFSIDF